jgi:hypothetical protein
MAAGVGTILAFGDARFVDWRLQLTRVGGTGKGGQLSGGVCPTDGYG